MRAGKTTSYDNETIRLLSRRITVDSTRAGDIETKTNSVYSSNAIPPTDSIASFIPIPAKLAADSTSPRVYALFVLASAIER